jgi:hypothetical protein
MNITHSTGLLVDFLRQEFVQSNFFSFGFDNSCKPVVCYELNNSSYLNDSTGLYRKMVGVSPFILNSINFNQPYTGADTINTVFSTGELIVVAKNGYDLVGYFARDSFDTQHVLSSGVLSGKRLVGVMTNSKEYLTRDNHAFSIVAFTKNELNGDLSCFETKYQTNLQHTLFDEYSDLTSGTGLFYGGWGHAGTSFNSLHSENFITRMSGYYTYLPFSITGSTESQLATGNVVRNFIEVSSTGFGLYFT